MNDIKWVKATDTVSEAFEGEVKIGMVWLSNTDWYWQMLVDDGSTWQVTQGREYFEHAAKQAVEDCRSDQFARSGRGLLRWDHVGPDMWLAYSGVMMVGSVGKGVPSRAFVVQFMGETPTRHDVGHAKEARSVVEGRWRDFLEVADLMPKPKAGEQVAA